LAARRKKFEFNIPEIYNTGILLSHKITSFSDTVIAYNIDLLTLQANDEKYYQGDSTGRGLPTWKNY